MAERDKKQRFHPNMGTHMCLEVGALGVHGGGKKQLDEEHEASGEERRGEYGNKRQCDLAGLPGTIRQ